MPVPNWANKTGNYATFYCLFLSWVFDGMKIGKGDQVNKEWGAVSLPLSSFSFDYYFLLPFFFDQQSMVTSFFKVTFLKNVFKQTNNLVNKK